MDIQTSIRLAALESDLETFPQGLDTQIGEQGMRVSGGQRQRIALARALAASPYARPGLLLLDDPFSAVDLQTEQQIIRALRLAYGPRAPLEKRATIILASHRLLTFPLADRVVVLNNGRIVETGRHVELLAAGGLYAQIFNAQSRVLKTCEGKTMSTQVNQRKYLAELVKPYGLKLMLIGVVLIAGALCELVPPLVMQQVIDGHLTTGQSNGLVSLALIYLGVVGLIQVLGFIGSYLTAITAQSALRDLRVRLFDHFQKLPVSYFDRTPLGDTLSRCTADVDTIDTLFSSGVSMLVTDMIRLVTLGTAMIVLSPQLSLVSALTIPGLVWVTNVFRKRIREAERSNRLAVSLMNSQLQETLVGLAIIKVYNRSAAFVRRFRSALKQALNAANNTSRYASVYTPIMDVLMAVVITLLIVSGAGSFFENWQISLGTLIAFILVVSTLL